MIQATDLRIGNIIKSKKSRLPYWEVQSMDIPFIDQYPERYEPLPLTEEWLVKFEKINWISKDVGGIFYWINGEKKHLKFVNSLQNTYFCIEQKELLCVNI